MLFDLYNCHVQNLVLFKAIKSNCIKENVDPVRLFLSLSSESEFRRKPPPIAISAVAEINIHVC